MSTANGAAAPVTPGGTPRPPGKGGRLDNYKLYRPEAVKAYSLRRAGEPWSARPRFEGWIILGLTLLATLAVAALVTMGAPPQTPAQGRSPGGADSR